MKNALIKSEEFEKYYQMLGNDKKNELFLSMKDVFMLAAVVGFLENKRKPISKSAGEPIKLNIFNSDDMNIMDIISIISMENEISILTKERNEEKYTMIEEYANGGMETLVRSFCNPVPNIEELKKFIQSFESDKKNPNQYSLDSILSDAINNIY